MPDRRPLALWASTAGSWRLIDAGALHLGASVAGAAERHGHGETAHTTHIWWARRPHSAMRALVFATLCQDGDADALALSSRLAERPLGEDALLEQAERRLLAQYGRRPRVLDMFGGGGTIALEAANLGAETTSIDVNELSAFIQQAQLCAVPAERIGALRAMVQRHGRRVLARLAELSAPLFPLRGAPPPGLGAPFVYLWSWSQRCEGCGARRPLSRRPWLSRKPGRGARLVFEPDKTGLHPSVQAVADPLPKDRAAALDRACPRCAAPLPPPSVRSCQEELVALICPGQGKHFLSPLPGAVPELAKIQALEAQILGALDAELPRVRLPRWSGVVNPALYGIETHAEVFNPRQRVVLLALILALREEQAALAGLDPGEGRFVLAALSAMIDQVVDWNCRLSMWIPQNEQVGRALCGPGLAMLWDYAETDPLLSGPANLHAKLARIVAGLGALAHRRGPVDVRLADARRLPLPDASVDAIVTDPPYYDNLFYSVLADFVYVWKRLLLAPGEPTLFAAEQTADGGAAELVASVQRAGGQAEADARYTADLGAALREAARVLRPDGTLSLVFGHGARAAWRCLIRAFRASGLRICSVQPLGIERRARPRALRSRAVNTCVALVARHGALPRAPWTPEALLEALDRTADPALLAEMQAAGWPVDDQGMALFARGVGLLANVPGIMGADDDAALDRVAAWVRARCPDFVLSGRGAL